MSEIRKCLVCETEFKIVRQREMGKRFCSTRCLRVHEAEHGRPAAQVASHQFKCKVCGKEFEMKPAYFKAYRKRFGKDPAYCSRKCFGLGKRLSTEQWVHHCLQCGKPMPPKINPKTGYNRRTKYLCSSECRSLYRRRDYRSKHPDQGITRQEYNRGYVRIVIPGKGDAPSYQTLEHRYVMEEHLGRRLLPEETVHHINGQRNDNRLSNLELFSSQHGPGQRVIDKVRFAIEILRLYPDFARAEGVMLTELGHSSGPLQPSDFVERVADHR